jgi:hypothetical protein
MANETDIGEAPTSTCRSVFLSYSRADLERAGGPAANGPNISRVAAEKLGEIETRIGLLLAGSESKLTYAAAADLMHALDEAVVDEIASWQSVSGAKHLALPA